MKPIIFQHFYTIPFDCSFSSAYEQSKRIGKNPLFLMNGIEITGYISPSTIDKERIRNPHTAIHTLVQPCATTTFSQLVQAQETSKEDVILIEESGTPVAWTMPTRLLPRIAVHPLEDEDNIVFAQFAHWIPKITGIAKELKMHVYLVGGAVRDFIQHKEIQDIDFLVQGSVYQLIDELHKQLGGKATKELLFEAGHWTTEDGCRFDFTVARSEWYPKPASLPETQRGTLLDDIMRRDFSINAMLVSFDNKGNHNIIDATNGQKDLRNKLLRILHPLSFHDDPTRIFRGARYAARYGLKCTIDTQKAVRRCLSDSTLKALSLERIGKEIQYIFEEENPILCWELLQHWGILNDLFPKRIPNFTRVSTTWNHLTEHNLIPVGASRCTLFWLTMADQLCSDSIFAPLVSNIKKGQHLWSHIAPILNTMRAELSHTQDNADIGTSIHKASLESIILLFSEYPQKIIWWLSHGQYIHTCVDGRFLITQGCPKGPKMGEALRAAQRAAWNGTSPKEQREIAHKTWRK